MKQERNSMNQDDFIADSKDFIKLEKNKSSFPFVERWKKFVA
jgi:hypothetical protein